MSVWGYFLTKRKFLLPAVITVSLLVALLGMRIPNCARPLKNKSSTRAVLEAQAKECKEGLKKCAQPVTPCGGISTFAPICFSLDTCRHETRCDNSPLLTSTPARASPFFSC